MKTLSAGLALGDYRLIAEIGRGGMGAVWEVEDAGGRRLALKAPVDEVDGDSEAAKRFAREVNAQQVLGHPNLVAAERAFTVDGTLYLVMERVTGESLGRMLRRSSLAPRRALVLARQVLEGLAHAHSHGIAHRDLKPDNVMVVQIPSNMPGAGAWEQVKILDFGMVKLMGSAASLFGGSKLTRTGMVAGTPMYMAPEQALGREVDGRADIYALGVILYEMLAGRPPFDDADPVNLMRMQVKLPAPRLDEMPGNPSWCTAPVVALVDRALQKAPDQRYPDARAMIAALDAAFLSLDGR